LGGLKGKQKRAWTECEDPLCYLQVGHEESFASDRENPEELAYQLREQGRSEQDPYMLRQARLILESTGKHDAAQEAYAEALSIEEDMVGAGRVYAKLGKREEAVRCLWEGEAFDELAGLATKFPELAKQLRHRAAVFMTGEQEPRAAERLREPVLRWLREGTNVREAVRDKAWKRIAGAMVRTIAGAPRETFEGSDWTVFADDFLWLRDQGLVDRAAEGDLARVAARGKRPEEAIRLWERRGETTDREYVQAKAATEPFPDRLRWLTELGDHSAIVREWETNGRPARRSDASTLQNVATAYESTGDYQGAVRTLAQAPEAGRLIDLAGRIVGRRNLGDQILEEIVVGVITARGREGRWREALHRASREGLAEFPDRRRSVLSVAKDGDARLARAQAQAVAAMARSDELLEGSKRLRPEAVAFLERVLGPARRGWPETGHVVPPALAGAAIERTGHHLNAIRFYEAMLSREDMKDFREEALARLVACRRKRLEFLEGRGAQTHEIREAQRAFDAAKANAAYVIDPQDPPRSYPSPEVGDWVPEAPVAARVAEPGTPTPGSSRAGGVRQWRMGPIELKVSYMHMRLRIEHTGEFDVATLDLLDGAAPRGGGAFEPIPHKPREFKWRSDTWDVTLRVRHRREYLKLTVEAHGEEQTIELPRVSEGNDTDAEGPRA